MEGKFSDNELIGLVEFARSKPRFGPSGRYPIAWIRPDTKGVYIGFSDVGGTGEGIVVKRTKHGWTLVHAGAWVS